MRPRVTGQNPIYRPPTKLSAKTKYRDRNDRTTGRVETRASEQLWRVTASFDDFRVTCYKTQGITKKAQNNNGMLVAA
jgi:hypothetical protein